MAEGGSCIPSLAVKIFKIPSLGGAWIFFDDFIQLLKSKRTQDDKGIRKDNILAELRRKDGIKEFGNEKVVSFQILLRFCFSHCCEFSICDVICSEIGESLLNSCSPVFATEEELYAKIVVTNFHTTQIGEFLLKQTDFDEENITTLNEAYSSKFTSSEWKRIMTFEWHFSQNHPPNPLVSYEEKVRTKWQFFFQCKSVSEIALSLQSSCRSTASKNKARQSAAKIADGTVIYTNSENEVLLHIPDALDQFLLNQIERSIGNNIVEAVVSVGCHEKKCDHPKSIHVFLETPWLDDAQCQSIAAVLRDQGGKVHHVIVQEIVFLATGTLAKYRTDCDAKSPIQRHILRDDIYTGKLKDHVMTVIHTSRTNRNRNQPNTLKSADENNWCDACLTSDACMKWISDPLRWSNFNLTKEWTLHVPLKWQILLEAFASQCTQRTQGSKADEIISAKLYRLYNIFDSLLNVQNRKYFGLLQQMNTLKLYSYHGNISTTFAVTSKTGITTSLRSAEDDIRSKATSDKCYYNCYLKKHPLTYDSSNDGYGEHLISLSDCLPVFLIDNLLRQTVHSDPQPGSSRTSQLCTLPITVKGLPKDSRILEDWHDKEICDGTDSCACKDMIKLGKDDKDLLLKMTSAETTSWNKFSADATWDTSFIWEALHEDINFKQIVADAILFEESDLSVDHVEDMLNKTMESMCLHDKSNADDEVESEDEDDDEEDDNEDEVDDPGEEHDQDPNHLQGMLDTISLAESDEEGDDLHEDDPYDGDDHSQDIGSFHGFDDIFPLESIDFDIEPMNENAQHVDKSLELTPAWEVFSPPPLLCRRASPAIGRDDDIAKIREVCDDQLIKMGYLPGITSKDRVLTAPDNKLSKLFMILKKQDPKYHRFICEFPLLHLRKSKIVNLCSGYKDAMFLHLLRFMFNNEETKDWMRLVDVGHIEKATKNIRRMAIALHIAFLVQFLHHLDPLQAAALDEDMKASLSSTQLQEKWGAEYDAFIHKGQADNATFSLHVDVLKHCDEIVAIALAERIGGHDGYQLLLAAVKSSMKFAFVNNASSYAVFCIELLHEHYSAGHFYKKEKETLFTTPHDGNNTNVALDSQREMDHVLDLKAFRSSATIASIVPRIALHDMLLEAKEKHPYTTEIIEQESYQDRHSLSESAIIKKKYFIWTASENDKRYILPTAALIYRQNGLDTSPGTIPRNVYAKEHRPLPETLLDRETDGVAMFLMERFLGKEGLLGLTEDDTPKIESVEGPKVLVSRVKRGKSVTVNRAKCKAKCTEVTERQKKEKKRRQQVASKTRMEDCLSSEMNACLAVLKPDLTKPTVNKSDGIKKALIHLLENIHKNDHTINIDPIPLTEKTLAGDGLVHFAVKKIPYSISQSVTNATIEFAGVKFKTVAKSGKEYLKKVERYLTNDILGRLPHLQRLVLCEEKYLFTPDNFKAATRAKRKKLEDEGISHLKTRDEILNLDNFSKRAVTGTEAGKKHISTYLPLHLPTFNIKSDVTIDLDSEYLIGGCSCSDEEKQTCECKKFSIPIRVVFSSKEDAVVSRLANVQQCKGEGEMAQVDWLADIVVGLEDKPSDAVMSIVSSGDIDAIFIHLFAISLYWPRKPDDSFTNDVYVLLQKPTKMYDIYNITRIIRKIEIGIGTKYAAMKVAIVLAMGGNDFIPKLHGISHVRLMDQILKDNAILSIVTFTGSEGMYKGGVLNQDQYLETIKCLYTPAGADPQKLSFDEVRQLSVRRPGQKLDCRNPKAWMPPKSALQKLINLINSQIEYLFTLWCPDADLPDFLANGGLILSDDGVQYDFGPDSRVSQPNDLLVLPEKDMKDKLSLARGKVTKKRPPQDTPQKGERRKRRPMMSTPQKSKENSSSSST